MSSYPYKSGFVTMIGRPNVGKSTLMNQLIGQKVAIMSDKVQTTRNRIQGILTDQKSQIVFVDTPGIHKPFHRLGDFMVDTAFQATRGVDAILVVVNASEPIGTGDRKVIDHIKHAEVPVFLIINKIDLIGKEDIIPLIQSYLSEYDFDEVYPISATEGDNLPELLEGIRAILPEGPQYYPTEQVMDHPEYFVVSEFIREKVLHLTHEEVPHSVAVHVESMRRDSVEDYVEIHAAIIVERKSQKGIIIGKGGKRIKRIRQLAQRDIQNVLGSPIELNLWVKVQRGWFDRVAQLNELGYRPDDY